MNSIFNAKRFVNYLRWDVNNAAGKFGISAIVLSLVPFFYFVGKQLIFRLFNGFWAPAGAEAQAVSAFIVYATTILSFPVKAYGALTEKKFGSSWALLPASVFEKWLSTILTVCVIVPLAVGVPFIVCDTLMSWIFPVHYGSSILGGIDLEFLEEINDFNIGLALYGSFALNLLAFTLGAVFFKRAKVAWTFTVYFLIGCFTGLLLMKITGQMNFSTEELMDLLNVHDKESMIRFVNCVITSLYAFEAVLLGAGLYARFKTIKF